MFEYGKKHIFLILLLIIILVISVITVVTIFNPLGINGDPNQETFSKTITVKMLSPTGTDLGIGIFATDGNGYLAYPQDNHITIGEKNIVVNGTYDIIYSIDNVTHTRIISSITKS